MSLKTTPKGLLAALTVVCAFMVQLPAVSGTIASAASAGAPRAAAPIAHAVHAAAPRVIRPRAASLTASPAFGPLGTNVLISGSGYPTTTTVTTTESFQLTQPATTTTVAASRSVTNTTSSSGSYTSTFAITSGVATSTTVTITGFANVTNTVTTTFFVEPKPTISVAAGLFIVNGSNNTLSVSSSSAYTTGNTAGTFLPSEEITFTFGLSGTAGTAITPTAPITTDANGVFAGAMLPFSPAVAGTYVLTATDGINVAATTVTVTPPGPSVSTTYFPEGYTAAATARAPAYSETLSILNPNVVPVAVTTTYLLEQASADVTASTSIPDVVAVSHVMQPLQTSVINVANDIASTAVSSGPDAGKMVSGLGQKVATIVQTAGYGNAIRGAVAERIIERTPSSGTRLDGDVSVGSTSPNTTAYFSEGYTGITFQEYLLLLNPSPTVTATVSIVPVPEGSATTQTPFGPIILAPLQRLTINVNRLNAANSEKKIGLIVNSADNPFVAERVLYFGTGNGSAKTGETIASGTTTAAKQLMFAYVSLTGSGDVTSTIPANSDVAQTADDRPFISVTNPNIANQVVAGTLSGSAAAPGPSAHVTIQLRGENGRLAGFFVTDVDAGARFTLTDADLTSSSGGIAFPGVPPSAPTRAGVLSVVVSSSERVVAEEAQYYGQGSVTPSGDANAGAPGAAFVGAPTGETDVIFPALSTTDPALVGTAAASQPLSQTVFLYNPGVDPIQVNGTFYGASGVVAHQTYTIGADAIQVIGQASASSGGAASGMPIPAGTLGAEFTVVQLRGGSASGEPAQATESFIATAVTHSADGSNWWGTQGLYPLPLSQTASGTGPCTTSTGAPLGTGCP